MIPLERWWSEIQPRCQISKLITIRRRLGNIQAIQGGPKYEYRCALNITKFEYSEVYTNKTLSRNFQKCCFFRQADRKTLKANNFISEAYGLYGLDWMNIWKKPYELRHNFNKSVSDFVFLYTDLFGRGSFFTKGFWTDAR